MDSRLRGSDGSGGVRGWLRLCVIWLRWGEVAPRVSLLVLDLLSPRPLRAARNTSSVVVARDGTPLRAFADAEGVWRHPADPAAISPLYLQALLTYEDRWF